MHLFPERGGSEIGAEFSAGDERKITRQRLSNRGGRIRNKIIKVSW
jgi:hypothetical protein